MSTYQEEAKKALGRLVTAAYKAKGDTRQSAAKGVGMSPRSLYAIEVGESVPRRGTQETLEKYLGWRSGSIEDLLTVGPNVDFEAVTLRVMQAKVPSEWVAPTHMVSEDEAARRIGENVQDLVARLKAAEFRLSVVERELREERNYSEQLQADLYRAGEALKREQKRSAALANGFELAADDSPNKGAELRAVLDEVAEGNRNVGGVG